MSEQKNTINWKEPSKDEVDCALLVRRSAAYARYTSTSDATLDDLRKACEAVGLVVIEKAEVRDQWDENAVLHRAEMAEAALQGAVEEAGALRYSPKLVVDGVEVVSEWDMKHRGDIACEPLGTEGETRKWR